jgi:flagellar protein FlgJ
MDLSAITDLSYSNAQSSASSAAASSLTSAASGLSSDSSEEELKGVLKDFESYFVEQMLKEVKESLTSEDEDSDSSMTQYKDMFFDEAIQLVADELVDDLGENVTQQLYEQMKRNYGITSTSESTDLSE